MIKFIMSSKESDRKIFGMVITRANINNLLKDMPIHFHAEQMNLSEIKCHEVIISFYETEELAIAALKKAGVMEGARIIRESRERH